MFVLKSQTSLSELKFCMRPFKCKYNMLSVVAPLDLYKSKFYHNLRACLLGKLRSKTSLAILFCDVLL